MNNYPDDYELAEFINDRIKHNTESWRHKLDPRDPDYLEDEEDEN